KLSLRIIRSLDLPEVAERRRANYLLLHDWLEGVLPAVRDSLPAGVCPLFYPLVVMDKDRMRAPLAALGLETLNFWSRFPPACAPALFPDAAWLRRHVLEIPCHQDLSLDTMESVARAVQEAKHP